MPIERTALATSLVAATLLFAGNAAAEDDAASEALFNKGLSEMEAGRYETACPTLRESQRLGPRMGTLFTLAECEAKGGQIASALAHYEEYLRQFSRLTPQQKTAQAGRDKISTAQKTALSPLVPHVTLTLPPGAPANTTVKWDELVFNLPALGVPLPVNPGEHLVTTQVPGGASHSQRIFVEKGERKQVELKLPAQPAAKERVAPPPSTTLVPATEDGADADGATTDASRKTWMYVAGAVGASGILVGSVTGALVLGKKGTIEDNCIDSRCNTTGKEAADTAQSLGMVSTVGFGIGIAGLATAAVLLLTEPSKAAVPARSWAPLVADRSGGLVLGVSRAW